MAKVATINALAELTERLRVGKDKISNAVSLLIKEKRLILLISKLC